MTLKSDALTKIDALNERWEKKLAAESWSPKDHREKKKMEKYRVFPTDRHKRKRHCSASRNDKTNLKKAP